MYTSAFIVLVVTFFCLKNRDALESRVSYFWGPYNTVTHAGRVIRIPKLMQDCTNNHELARLSQLNLLKVNGTCEIQLTDYSKHWVASYCPGDNPDKFHCVFIQVFNENETDQTMRKGDLVEATLSSKQVGSQWTPWIAADRKFSPNQAQSVTTPLELEDLLTKLRNTISFEITQRYEWDGRGQWRLVSSSGVKHGLAIDPNPFEGISSLR